MKIIWPDKNFDDIVDTFAAKKPRILKYISLTFFISYFIKINIHAYKIKFNKYLTKMHTILILGNTKY